MRITEASACHPEAKPVADLINHTVGLQLWVLHYRELQTLSVLLNLHVSQDSLLYKFIFKHSPYSCLATLRNSNKKAPLQLTLRWAKLSYC